MRCSAGWSYAEFVYGAHEVVQTLVRAVEVGEEGARRRRTARLGAPLQVPRRLAVESLTRNGPAANIGQQAGLAHWLQAFLAATFLALCEEHGRKLQVVGTFGWSLVTVAYAFGVGEALGIASAIELASHTTKSIS